VGAVSNQRVRAGGLGCLDGSRDRKDIEAQIEGVVHRDQGTAPLGGLDNHDRPCEGRDEPIPPRKVIRSSGFAWREFAHNQSLVEDSLEEPAVSGRMRTVRPRPEDCDGAALTRKPAPMRGPVDPKRHPAHHGHPRLRELPSEPLRSPASHRRCTPRSDDGDRALTGERPTSAEEEERRRIDEREEGPRVFLSTEGNDPNSEAGARLQNFIRPCMNPSVPPGSLGAGSGGGGEGGRREG
jgi:hypothetical protein